MDDPFPRAEGGIIEVPPDRDSSDERVSLYETDALSPANLSTSLDLNTDEGKRLLLAAMSPSDLVIDPAKPMHMAVTNYVVYRDKAVDAETGELKSFVRVALIDTDGKIVRTTGIAVVARVGIMSRLFGAADWRAGIRVVLSAKMGKRQRLYHDLQLERPEQTAIAPAKKK